MTVDLRAHLAQILANEALSFEFQPLADLVSATIIGYEGLMRGPADSPLHSPEVLLRVARSCGRLIDLEAVAALGAVRMFGRLGLPGKLFVNLSAPAISSFAADRGSRLFRTAFEAGVAPGRLMLELTEHERVDEPEQLQAAYEIFVTQGVGVALDDFGDGRSSLRLWSQLRPEIVKLDKYFTLDIDRDSRKVDVVRAMISLADRFGTLLVAEGVENASELAVLRDLGCRYAQGYLIGPPSRAPATAIAAEALAVLASSKIAVLPNAQPSHDIAEMVVKLSVRAPALASSATIDAVRAAFAAHPGLHALPVVENGYPVGLINRRSFLDRYAQPFYHELFGRRSCTLVMDTEPLRVDGSLPIDSMARMLAGDDQRYLFEGFIITEGGRYSGLATGESLVKAVTERRIEAARHANPLTFLPGNIPITEHIGRLLDASARFAACYFDLNHFKPFNDLYGYWRGDEMIKLAARVIQSSCDPTEDFVGHVGGDDFIVLFQSDDWMIRCRRIVADFNRQARSLFEPADLERNGFESEDRQGFRVHFPLTTIAVGAVLVEPGARCSPEGIASAAALAKKTAKQAQDGVHFEPSVCSSLAA